jgi:hypothetical protein
MGQSWATFTAKIDHSQPFFPLKQVRPLYTQCDC